VRTLRANKRGGSPVCAIVQAPTSEEEDRRHISRERKTRLDELRIGDGRPLPGYLMAQISRKLDRLELFLKQIKVVEAKRDHLHARAEEVAGAVPPARLLYLKGIGQEAAAVLWAEGWAEGLFRTCGDPRQVAAYAGLAPTPWKSGSVEREQGVPKAGNSRLHTTMIQFAWLWLRHQPRSPRSL
jgi:transposase